VAAPPLTLIEVEASLCPLRPSLSELVNALLKKDIELIEAVE
jgi:hypothetical protein